MVFTYDGFVKSTSNMIFKLFKNKLIIGFAWKSFDFESALSEPAKKCTSRMMVCPKVSFSASRGHRLGFQ